MRHFFESCAVAFAFVLGWSGVAFAHADKPVHNIYLPRGWVEQALPELVAQLEIPAILEIGRLELPPPPEDEYRLRWSDRVIPPDRLIKEFEFDAGTVGQALDAFCELNPEIQWREQEGVFILHRARGYTHDDSLLEEHIDHIARPLNTALACAWQIENQLRDQSPALHHLSVLPHDRGMWVELWAPRTHSDYPMSLDLHDVAVRQVMLHILGRRNDHFWIHVHAPEAILQQPSTFQEGHTLVFTNWSAVRRLASIEELMAMVNPMSGELHGYRDVEVRIEDAQDELRRRAHFHPQAVREALLHHQHWDLLIAVYFDYYQERALENRWTPLEFEPLLDVMLEVADEQFAMSILERLTRDDGITLTRKHQSARMTLLDALPMPNEPRFELALPYWRRLATDSDDYARRSAQRILQWHDARTEWLKAQTEQKDTGPKAVTPD